MRVRQSKECLFAWVLTPIAVISLWPYELTGGVKRCWPVTIQTVFWLPNEWASRPNIFAEFWGVPFSPDISSRLSSTGTLFLDEVGDIPPALQPKLLRVLQEQEFERLGSGRTHKVDVRLVAATNRDLVKMEALGQFRSDLYYRLNVFPIVLPALRERREDIPALVAHFVKLFSRRMGKDVDSVPPETMIAFQGYSWPGNIRELQNLVERAVILSRDGVLPNPLHKEQTELMIPSLHRTRAVHSSMTLEDADRALIVETLEQAGWIVGGPGGAAAKLGLKRTTLLAKMRRLDILRPIDQERISLPGVA